MRSCNNCPGGTACSGNNLAPVLKHVFELYAGGEKNKFDILFALSEEEEKLLETHTTGVERACWTRAGLVAVTGILIERLASAEQQGSWASLVEQTIATAKDAFADFPWHLPDLVDQAPDLHASLVDQMEGDLPQDLSKRAFVKICKTVVYG
jgi:hypothetical protein